MVRIHKRADGRYATTILGPDGKRAWLYGHSAAEVEEKYLQERRSGGTNRQPITLGDYLDRWLAEQVTKRPKTRRAYTWACGHLGGLRGHRLRQLNRSLIQRQFNTLITKLSANSCRRVYEVLHNALGDAVADRLIEQNPCERIDLPTVEREDGTVIDPDLARRIVEAVAPHRLAALYVTVLALGLRQGEALGLGWDDLDFESGIVQLRQQVQSVGGTLTLVPLKTRTSRAVLPVPQVALAALAAHRERQQLERRLAGDRWVETGRIFVTERGHLIHGTVAGHTLTKLLAKAALPHITFHGLRHGTASLLAAAQVHPSLMRDVMRHSDIKTTMQVYTHTTFEGRRQALRRIDDALSG